MPTLEERGRLLRTMTKSASEVREDLKQRRKKKGGKYDWLKITEAESPVYIRIGPPSKEDGEIWKDVYFHGSFKRKVYCSQNEIDEETGKRRKCKVEKRLAELKHERNKRGRKLWSLISQRSEGLWNVLVAKVKRRSDGTLKVLKYKDNKFKLLRLSYKWHNALLDIFADEDYRRHSILGVAHPKYGRLIKVTRSGSGRDDTNYTFKPVEKESPILKDDHDRHKILKTLINLDDLVHGSSKDEIESFLHKMEKKAKSIAKRDEDESKGDSDADSDSESAESESRSSSSESSSSSSDDGDDLQKQYEKMKKELKKRKKKSKKHHRRHESDESKNESESEEESESES